jgi:CRP-like cAMP-binding protein
MFNSNDEGKEFTQGYFCNGQSFGEPPLFIDDEISCNCCCFSRL